MDIKKYKEWKESEDYKKIDINSNIILYKNYFTEVDNDWGWGIWGGRDVPDEWLKQNQKEYPDLEIKRMNVQ